LFAAKKIFFESKRKAHYNEYFAVKLARQLMEKEGDDDEEEGGGGGQSKFIPEEETEEEEEEQQVPTNAVDEETPSVEMADVTTTGEESSTNHSTSL
jgi:hypothetical protein